MRLPYSCCLLLVLASMACGAMRNGAARCPTWSASLSAARAMVPCDSRHRATPDSKCLAALERCHGGCDICQFLGGPDEIKIMVSDEDEWAPIKRVPIDAEPPNGYLGKRASEEVGFFSRTYKLNWHLCHDGDFTDVLASTLMHESMHACASVQAPGILDRRWNPPPGCSAEELENVCAAK